jgi:flagellar biosynthesis regulator FlbT
MNSYSWEESYLAAVRETDKNLMEGRIYEALAAVERRRLSPVESDGDEDRALKNVEAGIKALIAERLSALNA